MKLSAETTAEQKAATAHPLKYSLCRATLHGRCRSLRSDNPIFPKRGLRTHAPLLCISGMHAGAKSSLQVRELTMYGESSTELNGARLLSGPG